jgi:hypothetical protein
MKMSQVSDKEKFITGILHLGQVKGLIRIHNYSVRF